MSTHTHTHTHVRPLMEEQIERQDGDAEVGRGMHGEEAEDGQRAEAAVGQGVMEGNEADEHDRQRHAGEGPEESAICGVRDPGQPTREERERHEVTRLPFRPWCADCVSGRAANDPLRRRARIEDIGPPRISVDYGFIPERSDGYRKRDALRTILVVKADGCGAVMAKRVSGKGREDPLAVGWLIDELRRLGLGRCILEEDGEPAQSGYVKDDIEEAARTSSLGIAAAHTPPHDHRENGSVEKAVRDVKHQIRVMRCALERRLGPISLHGALFEWLTISAAELLTGTRVGQDAMTAFRRWRGRPWEPRFAEFAEQVLARRPGGPPPMRSPGGIRRPTWARGGGRRSIGWRTRAAPRGSYGRPPQAGAGAVELGQGHVDHEDSG